MFARWIHEVVRLVLVTIITYRRVNGISLSLHFSLSISHLAYGKVFLVRKRGGHYSGRLFAMKVLKKATIVQKAKTAEHTRTERQVLEAVRRCPFLVTLHWAFQTEAKLHLIMGKLYVIIHVFLAKNKIRLSCLCFSSFRVMK